MVVRLDAAEVEERVILRLLIAAASALLAGCIESTSSLVQSVTFIPCNMTVSYFAFQPKDGSWTQVEAQNGGFSFTVPDQLTVAFTAVDTSSSGSAAHFYSMTKEEFIDFSSLPCLAGTLKTVSGSVASVPSGSVARVSVGNASTQLDPAINPTFQLLHSLGTTLDVVASTETATSGQTQATRLLIRRGQSVPSGTSVGTLAFTGAETVDVTTGTATVTGLTPPNMAPTPEVATFTERYYTGTRTNHLLVSAPASSTGTNVVERTVPNVVVPGSLSALGDFYIYNVTATAGQITRSVTRFDDAAGSPTLALGSSLMAITMTTLATSPFGRIRATAMRSEYPSFAYARFTQPNAAATGFVHQAHVLVSAGYVTAPSEPSNWTLEIPDLPQLPGYPAAATFSLPANVASTIAIYSGPLAAFFGLDRIPSVSVVTSVTRSSTDFMQ